MAQQEWSLAKFIDDSVRPSVVAVIGESEWEPWKVALRSAILRDRAAGKGRLSVAIRDNPEGALVALAKCAQLGLSPDPQLDHFALIPYGRDIQGAVMYRGWMHLALSSGHVEWMHADVVYKQEYRQGAPFRDLETNRVLHEPNVFERDGYKDDDIIGAYAMAKIRGVDRLESVILTRGEINKRRAKSKAPNGPGWVEWFPKMCLAKAYQALARTGRLPLSRAARCMAIDDDEEVFVETHASVVEEPKPVPPPSQPPPPPILPGHASDRALFDALDRDPFPDDVGHRGNLVEAIIVESVDQGLSEEFLAEIAQNAVGRAIERVDDSLTVQELKAILEAVRTPTEESGDTE